MLGILEASTPTQRGSPQSRGAKETPVLASGPGILPFVEPARDFEQIHKAWTLLCSSFLGLVVDFGYLWYGPHKRNYKWGFREGYPRCRVMDFGIAQRQKLFEGLRARKRNKKSTPYPYFST